MTDTLGAALRAAVARLRRRLDADEAERDARKLLAGATGWSGARVLAGLQDAFDPAAQARLDAMIAARETGRSVAHILGRQEFYGRSFVVRPGDLVPRPDTETLVELALSAPFDAFLDLGTGTGVIAVTLLAERLDARGLGTDIDADAYAAAAENAKAHGVADRLTLQSADWFDGVSGSFDLILSNPPYLSADEFARAPPEIGQGERRAALTPGGDGLDAYRAIAAGALRHLRPGGRLLVEIGHRQGTAVAGLFAGAGLDAIDVHPDINGKDRVVAAQAPTRGQMGQIPTDFTF
ncbi:MAG: peptide chain release factor N(5)-glutamine methyltransferase [Pseudomonadota bacterium]